MKAFKFAFFAYFGWQTAKVAEGVIDGFLSGIIVAALKCNSPAEASTKIREASHNASKKLAQKLTDPT